ncbi:YsnF/AvaK domain-containing protein, partial [Oscillatoriales cyanobacterium LEGE 11467]
YDYEERVRSVYRTPAAGTSTTVEASAPVETTAGVVTPPATTPTAVTPAYTANDYTYDREPDLYETREDNHQKLKLYEERLVTNKNRSKVGEVSVSKRVETSTAEVAVPVEKEKIVIEFTPGQSTPAATDPNFREGEVARMDVHEETAEIGKEAVVRGEVSVRKEVEQDTVTAKETIRREEVDVDRAGDPNIDRSGQL